MVDGATTHSNCIKWTTFLLFACNRKHHFFVAKATEFPLFFNTRTRTSLNLVRSSSFSHWAQPIECDFIAINSVLGLLFAVSFVVIVKCTLSPLEILWKPLRCRTFHSLNAFSCRCRQTCTNQLKKTNSRTRNACGKWKFCGYWLNTKCHLEQQESVRSIFFRFFVVVFDWIFIWIWMEIS